MGSLQKALKNGLRDQNSIDKECNEILTFYFNIVLLIFKVAERKGFQLLP